MRWTLKLHDESMLGAARGRLESLQLRWIIAVVLTGGAALVLDTLSEALIWLAAMALSMSCEAALARRYVAASTEMARRRNGLAFVMAFAVTTCVFAGMVIWLAYAGGPAGRVLSVLMAAASLVFVMLFLFQAPLFILMAAAPCAICLLIAAVLPFAPTSASPLAAGLGIACGVSAFLTYVWRGTVNNARMFRRVEAATREAQARAVEADMRAAEAQEANRAKSEFLATMTHELRTPLNAVIGYSELIEEELAAAGRTNLASDSRRVGAAAKHLLGLIDQILRLSTMETGDVNVAAEEFDVRLLVETAVASSADEARARNNQVAVHVGPDAMWAHTDFAKLELCLLQLLSNAARFTNDGVITVAAECERIDERDWLKLSVSDTGIGMAPDQIARALQPFTQVDGSTTRRQGGIGLGLSIASSAARMLGGAISVESELGAGSTFTIRAPLRLAETAASAAPRAAA